MSIVFYSIYTLLNLALLFWGIGLWLRNHRAGTLMIAAVTFGLMYDNLILAGGNFFGSKELLYWVSLPRFVLHQLVLPWVIFASFEQVRLMGHAWAQKRAARLAAALMSGFVMLLGVLTRILPMNLQLVEMDQVTRFVDAGAKGAPIVSIVSIGFAGVMGLLLWRKNQFSWLFLSALLVFIGEGIPIEWVRRVLGSGAEVLFIISMLLLEKRIDFDRWVNRSH